MSNLQSIQPRLKLTQEMIDEIESAFLMLSTARIEADGKVVNELEAQHLPRVIKGLGLFETDTVRTVSKSQGLYIPLDTVLQIACQALDSTDDYCESETRELFDLFDADGDGLLEAYELQRVLNTTGENIENDDMETQMVRYDTQYGGENLNFADWKHLIRSDPVRNQGV